MKRGHLSFGLLIPVLGVLCFASACGRQGTPILRLSTVDAVTMSPDELIHRTPFSAVVISAYATQNVAGISEERLPSRAKVTNAFWLSFRDDTGRTQFLGGINVGELDLDKLGQLQKGKSYTFPDTIITRGRARVP